MTYDFSGLTSAQKILLTYDGWMKYGTNLAPKPTAKTIDPLIAKGFAKPVMNGTELLGYAIPTDVHMAWCAYCSTQNRSEEE